MAVPIDSPGEFRHGEPKPLFQVNLGNTNGGIGIVDPFHVSPDGQRFLFTPPNVPTSPFTVLLNWIASAGLK